MKNRSPKRSNAPRATTAGRGPKRATGRSFARKPTRSEPHGAGPDTAARPRIPKTAPVLDSNQRKHLRSLAHHLEPVVQVGHQGVTDAVVRQVHHALAIHELIKVRLHEPQDKRGMAGQLAERTLAGLCGLIGHTVILFRPSPDHPRIVLSAPAKTAAVVGAPRPAPRRPAPFRG